MGMAETLLQALSRAWLIPSGDINLHGERGYVRLSALLFKHAAFPWT